MVLGGPSDAPRRVNLSLDVSVGYDESPPHVKTILREIIEDNELIITEPDPVILFTQMLDSALIFRINCWVSDYGDEWVAKDQIQTEILRRFKEEDIEIPYPHMQLKYDAATEDATEVKQKKEDERRARADKEKRQEEARQKEAEHAAKQAEERAHLRERAEELRKMLESEELEDEERANIGTELMQIESRISGSDDD